MKLVVVVTALAAMAGCSRASPSSADAGGDGRAIARSLAASLECPRSLADACCGPGVRTSCPLEWSQASSCAAWAPFAAVRVHAEPCAGYVAVTEGSEAWVYDAARGALVAKLGAENGAENGEALRCQGGPPHFAIPARCEAAWMAPLANGLADGSASAEARCGGADAGVLLRYCDSVDQSAVGAASE